MGRHSRIRWRNRLLAWLPFLSEWNEFRLLRAAQREWRRQGWQTPPPYFVRRAMILAEAKRIHAELFIETGTFLGDTVWQFRHDFAQIVTIEVEPRLAQLARERFRRLSHVRVIEGDSAHEMTDLCSQAKKPCVIFLDGHYSHGITGMGEQECPILKELEAIATHLVVPAVVIIDDARLFGCDPAYPSLADIEEFVRQRHGWVMRLENDAMVLELPGKVEPAAS